VSFAAWEERFTGAASGDLPRVSPDDPAQIQYTSGTTGAPKGALLHHRGLVTNAGYVWRRAGVGRGAIFASAMPLFHTAGCAMGVLGVATCRGTLLLLQLFDPELMLEAIETHRADAVLGVPTMHLALLEHPRFAETDTSSVRLAMSGGSPVAPELVRRVESGYGCRFSTVFGQTELSPIVTETSPDAPDEERLETSGQPLWNVEVKIAGLDGRPLPLGEQGEICARGYQAMLGYFDRPDETAATIDAEGWVHTGDLGTLDANGCLRVTGRLKDMIIRGGENVYPAEIELALFEHPQVADAVVVGIPDDRWGERVAAVVRPADPAAPPAAADLHAFCRASLAPHKTPVEWWLADAFPLTGSGKVRKFAVAEAIAARAYEPLA
jgi:fatty-acyl-CoA synthase